MELSDFNLKHNQGWIAFNSRLGLTAAGFKTQRLGKLVSESGLFQITIGSTKLGQKIGLNSEMEKLILAFFPDQRVQFIPTTNGSSDKPDYPAFNFSGSESELNEFLLKVQKLAFARAKEEYA